MAGFAYSNNLWEAVSRIENRLDSNDDTTENDVESILEEFGLEYEVSDDSGDLPGNQEYDTRYRLPEWGYEIGINFDASDVNTQYVEEGTDPRWLFIGSP